MGHWRHKTLNIHKERRCALHGFQNVNCAAIETILPGNVQGNTSVENSHSSNPVIKSIVFCLVLPVTPNVFCVSSEREKTYKIRYVHMTLNESKVKFQVDCGVTVNVIPQNVRLQQMTKKLWIWNGTKVVTIVKCHITILNPMNHEKYLIELTIVDEDLVLLQGKWASEQINQITVY